MTLHLNEIPMESLFEILSNPKMCKWIINSVMCLVTNAKMIHAAFCFTKILYRAIYEMFMERSAR